jgi:hypothetical protein
MQSRIGSLMNTWEGYERKQSWPNSTYYFNIFLEGLRKTTKNRTADLRAEI